MKPLTNACLATVESHPNLQKDAPSREELNKCLLYILDYKHPAFKTKNAEALTMAKEFSRVTGEL